MDCRVDCSNRKLLKDGERGRNRTYNLLIKSQLLCQLSYAPAAGNFLKKNFDYIIREGSFSDEQLLKA